MEEERNERLKAIREKLLKEYPGPTTDDLIRKIEKDEELLELMQKKLEQNKKSIRKWLSFMG